MGSGLAIEKRNFTALDYLVFPMIRPNPRAVLTLTEKAAHPFFFETALFLVEKVACPLFFKLL